MGLGRSRTDAKRRENSCRRGEILRHELPDGLGPHQQKRIAIKEKALTAGNCKRSRVKQERKPHIDYNTGNEGKQMESKVKATTEPAKLAGSIANVLKENDAMRLKCIGAGAVNQAVKGIIIAQGFAATGGYKFKITPAFFEVEGEEVHTGILFDIEKV